MNTEKFTPVAGCGQARTAVADDIRFKIQLRFRQLCREVLSFEKKSAKSFKQSQFLR